MQENLSLEKSLKSKSHSSWKKSLKVYNYKLNLCFIYFYIHECAKTVLYIQTMAVMYRIIS